MARGRAHAVVVRPGAPGGQGHLFGTGVGPGIGDVLRNGAVEQGRVLGHQGDGAPQGGLAHLGDVLAIDQDTARLHIIEPLEQLDEGGLARPRGADKGDLFPRRDDQGEVLIEVSSRGLVAEGHPVEGDLAPLTPEGCGVGKVGHLRRGDGVAGHILHVVEALLHHADVFAEIAQIAAHQHEGGDGEHHVAGAGLALRPQPQQQARQARLQAHQHQVVPQPDIHEPGPGGERQPPPQGRDAADPGLFPRFGAEGLHGRVGADGVRQGPADPRIQGHRLQVGWPHIDRGQPEVGHQIEDHHRQGEGPHHRPAGDHHHRQADQHDQGRPQPQDHRIGDHVIAPHAAAEPPHRGAGEGVGVPVRGVGLHPLEAFVGHVFHVGRGHRIPEPEGDVAHHGEGQEDADEDGPGPPGEVGLVGASGHDVHQPPRRPGQGEVEADGHQGEHHGGPEQDRPPQPEGADEAQNLAVGQGPLGQVVRIVIVFGHGVLDLAVIRRLRRRRAGGHRRPPGRAALRGGPPR